MGKKPQLTVTAVTFVYGVPRVTFPERGDIAKENIARNEMLQMRRLL